MSLSTSCGIFVVSTTGDNIRRWLFCKVLWFVSGSLCSDFAIKWNSPQIDFSPSCFTLTSSTLRVWISLDKLEFRSRWYSVIAFSFNFALPWPIPWFCQEKVFQGMIKYFFLKNSYNVTWLHETTCYLLWASKIWRPLLSKADMNPPSCSYEMNYLCYYYFSLATSPLVVCLTWAHVLENKDVFGCFWSVLVLVFADEVHCYTATHDDDIDGHDVFHPVKLIGTRILHYSLCFHLET